MEDFFKNFFATQSLFYPLVLDMIFPKSIVGTEDFQEIFEQFSHFYPLSLDMIFLKSIVGMEDFHEFFSNSVIFFPCPGHNIFKVKVNESRDGGSRKFEQLSHFYPLVLDMIFSKSRG